MKFIESKSIVYAFQKLIFLFSIHTLKNIDYENYSNVDFISVTCKRDFRMLIFAIYSLTFFSKKRFNFIILDDGTLTKHHINYIRKKIIGCQIYSHSTYVNEIARRFGKKSLFYAERYNPFVIKKMGAMLFSKAEKICFMDSDIVFFQQPIELLDILDDKKVEFSFIEDEKRSYIFSDVEIQHYMHLKQIDRVNSGLLIINRNLLDTNLLHDFLKLFYSIGFGRYPFIQQYFAIIAGRLNKSKIRKLPNSYLVSTKNEYIKVICRHYVTGVRSRYYPDSNRILKLIIKNNDR